MQFFPFVVVAWILAAGLYGIVTSRHLVHQIVCLIVVQSSTYVLLLGVGYKRGAAAPYFSDIPRLLDDVQNGLPFRRRGAFLRFLCCLLRDLLQFLHREWFGSGY